MNYKKLQFRKPGPLVFAFVLPMALYLLAMFLTNQPPFGEHPLLLSDCYHQYYPFFLELRSALREGGNLQWTWTTGMGADYLGQIAYYTASPLNLLTVLLPETWMLSYFCLLVPLKLSLSSLGMAYFLKKLHGKTNWALPLFSSAYAFCGWVTLYFWNVMWLDGLALLPLVTWSTIQLLREHKYLPYLLALAATLIVNYYIAIFICTFVLLLFVCYMFCNWQGRRAFFLSLARIAGYTVLTFGIASILLLPAAGSLAHNAVTQPYDPRVFPTEIIPQSVQNAATNAWTAYREARAVGAPSFKYAVEGIKHTAKLIPTAISAVINCCTFTKQPETPLSSMPPLYCGLFTLILVFLALLSKEMPLRHKIAYIGLIGFYTMGLIFNDISYIYHGMHYPASLPFRFAFVLSFIAVATAYQGWLHRSSAPAWRIPAAGIITCGFLLLSRHFRESSLKELNILVIFIFTGALALENIFCNKTKKQQNTAAGEATGSAPTPDTESNEETPSSTAKSTFWAACPFKPNGNLAKTLKPVAAGAAIFCIFLELIFAPIRSAVYYEHRVYDYSDIKAHQTAITKLQAANNDPELFYRTELTQGDTYNDSALYGFNGPSGFSSTDNDFTTQFLVAMGADGEVKSNRAYVGNNSPVTNLFTSVKYMLCTNNAVANNPLFELNIPGDGVNLYRNMAYLPLGFMADPELLGLTFSESTQDSFEFQNQLFSAATGIDVPVYTPIPQEEWLRLVTDDTNIIQENGFTISYTDSTDDKGYFFYTYTAQSSGLLTIYLYNDSKTDDYTVFRNSEELFTDSIVENCQMVCIGTVEEGDEIRIKISCPPQKNGSDRKQTTSRISGAILDLGVFLQGYDILNRNTLQLTEFSNTRVAGSIFCQEAGLLYTSIPQDGNWIAYIDGKKADCKLVGDVMLALDLSAGEHTVEFRYCNKAFVIGCCISGVSIVALIAIHIIQKKQQKKPDGENAAPASSKE